MAGLALGRLTVVAVRDTRVAARAARSEPVTAAPALRDRSARRPTPAGSPGDQPQPEPAGSAAHR